MFTSIRSLSKQALPVVAAALVGAAAVGCGQKESKQHEPIIVRAPRRAPVSLPLVHPQVADSVVAVAGSTPVASVKTLDVLPEVTYEEAEAAYTEKRYGEAIELFRRYTERKSENSWGFYMLGLAEWKSGNLGEAEAALRRALELDPEHVKSLINLSRVLLDMGRPADALGPAREAIAIDSESGAAYRIKGRIFHELGEGQQAVEAYYQAINLDNQDAWSMNNLGLLLIEAERFDDALAPLARAVEITSDNPIFLNNLGMALERTGHFREAERAYQAALTNDAGYGKASVNLERVTLVREDAAVPPIDLAVVARQFADRIESWSGAMIASEHPQAVQSGEPLTVIDADSSGVNP